MTPRRVFAALYFVGMTTGLVAGTMLPWWISGAPAWVLVWAVHDIASTHLPVPRGGCDGTWPEDALLRSQLSWARDRIVRSAVAGAFIGALSGAVASDLRELYAAFGLASRPLDGHLCGALACALVLADAWARGDAPDRVSPGLRGVVTYLVFVLVFGVLPVLAEVLP